MEQYHQCVPSNAEQSRTAARRRRLHLAGCSCLARHRVSLLRGACVLWNIALFKNLKRRDLEVLRHAYSIWKDGLSSDSLGEDSACSRRRASAPVAGESRRCLPSPALQRYEELMYASRTPACSSTSVSPRAKSAVPSRFIGSQEADDDGPGARVLPLRADAVFDASNMGMAPLLFAWRHMCLSPGVQPEALLLQAPGSRYPGVRHCPAGTGERILSSRHLRQSDRWLLDALLLVFGHEDPERRLLLRLSASQDLALQLLGLEDRAAAFASECVRLAHYFSSAAGGQICEEHNMVREAALLTRHCLRILADCPALDDGPARNREKNRADALRFCHPATPSEQDVPVDVSDVIVDVPLADAAVDVSDVTVDVPLAMRDEVLSRDPDDGADPDVSEGVMERGCAEALDALTSASPTTAEAGAPLATTGTPVGRLHVPKSPEAESGLQTRRLHRAVPFEPLGASASHAARMHGALLSEPVVTSMPVCGPLHNAALCEEGGASTQRCVTELGRSGALQGRPVDDCDGDYMTSSGTAESQRTGAPCTAAAAGVEESSHVGIVPPTVVVVPPPSDSVQRQASSGAYTDVQGFSANSLVAPPPPLSPYADSHGSSASSLVVPSPMSPAASSSRRSRRPSNASEESGSTLISPLLSPACSRRGDSRLATHSILACGTHSESGHGARMDRRSSIGSNNSQESALRKVSLVSETVVSSRCTADSTKLRQCVREELDREMEKEHDLELQNLPTYARLAARFVDSPSLVTTTTLLTIYALVGDDLRLVLTNKAADPYWDLTTCFCILVFCMEIVISCIAKQDYLLGFIFWLDVISTASLVLEITVVSDFLFYGNIEGFQRLTDSRSARIGARAARIVRFIRLLRIMKVYKVLQLLIFRSWQRQGAPDEAEEADETEDEAEDLVKMSDEDGDADDAGYESQVGKKLSDLTTRRCVMLVLAMMMVHPVLQQSEDDVYPGSMEFGASIVEEKFESMVRNESERWQYEEAVLDMLYFHNWYTKRLHPTCTGGTFCPSDYGLQVYWFGISGEDETTCKKKASAARLRPQSVRQWDEQVIAREARGLYYNTGPLPEVVLDVLGSDSLTECVDHSGSYRIGKSMIGERVQGVDHPPVACPERFRRAESQFVSAHVMPAWRWHQWHFVFVFDRRPLVQAAAFQDFWMTFVICAFLCVASAMFSNDARELVVKPVEMMMLKVHMIRINPLIAMKLTDDEYIREESMKARIAKREHSVAYQLMRSFIQLLMCNGYVYSKKRQPMETVVLEKTIVKLGTLLSLGFGAAGMKIISQNMQGRDSVAINAMIEGSTVECIIGYFRISDFTTFVEALQSRVMTFVNQVAEIIHGVATAFYGLPSRNSGDNFLVVWTVNNETPDVATRLGDMALLASVLALVGVNRSAVLATYRSNPKLQQRFGINGDCRVNVACGLHFGWAIEGALGTEYKIDATYVSPNVSIAESVEQAAEVYGTGVVLTEAAYGRFSPNMAAHCRRIDRVKITGSAEPMSLFTIDLDYTSVDVEESINVRWTTWTKFRARQLLEEEKVMRMNPEVDLSRAFDEHPDLQVMREAYGVEFRELFGMGYQNYSQGEWATAQVLLHRAAACLDEHGLEDGPSEALMRYMRLHQFVAPEGWQGVHALEEIPPRIRARSAVSSIG